MYDLIVYIGRFQPFHNGHSNIVKKISVLAHKTLIIVGSIDSARTIKNPFTFKERKDFIKNSVHVQKLQISGVADYTYDTPRWIKSISAIVNEACPNGKVAIAGHFKDESSSYLKYFPQWELVELDSYKHYGMQINATSLREEYYNSRIGYIENFMPPYVFDFMLSYMTTKHYNILEDEYFFIQKYKAEWKTPFPSVFVTVDALVVHAGHILLIKRKNIPGKGLWAIPGGFLDINETLELSALRELKEETNLELTTENISSSRVFDSISRGDRGRIITHVYVLNIHNTNELPSIEANDDAEEALWIPIGDFYNMRKIMYSDHYHIIESML